MLSFAVTFRFCSPVNFRFVKSYKIFLCRTKKTVLSCIVLLFRIALERLVNSNIVLLKATVNSFAIISAGKLLWKVWKTVSLLKICEQILFFCNWENQLIKACHESNYWKTTFSNVDSLGSPLSANYAMNVPCRIRGKNKKKQNMLPHTQFHQHIRVPRNYALCNCRNCSRSWIDSTAVDWTRSKHHSSPVRSLVGQLATHRHYRFVCRVFSSTTFIPNPGDVERGSTRWTIRGVGEDKYADNGAYYV